MCSRAALELLPYLVPGKGRGDKAARHLVDSRLVSYKMNTSSHRYNYLTKFFIYRNLQTWKNQSVKSQDLSRERDNATDFCAAVHPSQH